MMEIFVINGSPKGKNSVTLQTSRYLEILHPEHRFTYLHAATRLSSLRQDFSPAAEALKKAELVIFSYPVYTFLAPSQLHEFFALLKASDVDVRGKFTTQITTSKHFYDMTAHRYVQDNCQDLGMRALPGLSADMEDLTTPRGQEEARNFFDYLLWQMERAEYLPFPASAQPGNRVPATPAAPIQAEKTGDVVIVAHCTTPQLAGMIARFQAVLPQKSRVVELSDFPFRGGCLGCLRCAVDGKCVYTDGFDTFLREQIQSAQAVVYSFTIQDHSMGPLFKLYDDRQFCNGHRTVTMGSPVGYLISGDYAREPNLQTVIQGRAQVGGNFLAGVATDEEDTDRAIDLLAARLDYGLTHRYVPPRNFYGVGGMKIFRDLIYQMQGLMRADHRFFKAHGQYDFPQKHRIQRWAMYLVGAMMAFPALRAKIGDKMNEGMLAPYQKVLKQAEKAVRNLERGSAHV